MKRVLSLFLSCIFVLGVCFSTPIVASATGENTFIVENNVFQYNEGSNECSLKKWGNSSVDALTLPDIAEYNANTYTITGVLSGAFSECKNLKTLTIKSNIEMIEAGAFAGCEALTAFIESSESLNTNFEVVDGVLFNQNQTTLIAYPAAKEGAKYTIPSDVTEIATGAFSGASETLVLENSDPAKITKNTDGLVIHKVLEEGGHAVSGYVVSENDIKSVCFCGIELETVATIEYIGSYTDANSKSWTKEVKVLAKDGEFVSKNSQDDFSTSVTFTQSDKKEDGSISFYKKQSESAESVAISVKLNDELDSTVPTCVIKLGDSYSWNSLLDNITFGLFFKDTKTVSITSADENGSGVKSVEYYISTEVKTLEGLTALEETVWTELTLVDGSADVNLKPNSKNIVYARIIDNVGNVEYISSNGIVLYSDSKTETENISYTKFSDSTVTVDINLNGNTIKEVKNGDITLSKGADYEVSESAGVATLTFYKEMLDYLPIGESEITISYNLLGENYMENQGDAPSDTTINFTINKATPEVTIVKAENLVFTNEEQQLLTTANTTFGTLKFSLEDTEDETKWSTDIPKASAAGTYTVYYKVVGDSNVNDLAKQSVTVIISEHKHLWSYEANEETDTITATCTGEGCCGVENKTTTITLKLPENSDLVYNNEAKKFAFVDGSIDGVTTPEIVYSGDCINAGDYTASITLGEGDKAKSVSVEFTIEKAPATFTVPTGKDDLKYTGSAQELVTSGSANGGTIYYTITPDNENSWSTNIPTGIDDDTYTVHYKFVVDDNYAYTGENATTGICEVTIAPHGHSWTYLGDGSTNTITAKCKNCPLGDTYVTLTLIPPIQEELVYNGEAKTVSVYVSDKNANVIVPQPIYTYNGEEIDECKNAGDYKATITIGEAKAFIDFTITKATLEATDIPLVMPENPVYNGDSQTVTIENSGKISADNINVKYYKVLENGETESLDSAPVNAGTYKVNVNVAGENNYEDATALTCDEWQFTIAKKELSTIIIGGINPETYTGSPLTPSVNVAITDAEGGHPVTLAPEEYEVTYDKNINAGEAIVKITLIGNYTYTGNSEDLTKTFTINKATPDVKKFTFTAPENLTYDGNEKTATVVVKDGITGMGAITIKYYDANGALLTETPKSEGTYTVKIDVAEGTNFNATTEITSDDWKFTIEEHVHKWQYSASGAVITATCQNNGCDIKTTTVELVAPKNLVYDGTEKSVTVEALHKELLSEYTVTNEKATDAGKYTAFIKMDNATASLDFEISKAVIVVTKVTATDRVYNGTLAVEINKNANIEFTGLVSGDKVSFDLSALKGTLADANVGENKTVAITGSIVLTGEDAKNYWVSTPEKTTVNITPATVTITPDAKTSEQYYNLPAFTYKVTGLIGADTLIKAPTLTTNADIKTVGNYTITATGAEASANYVIKYATAPLTITAHKNHIVKDGTWKETVRGTCMVAGKEAGTCTLCGGTVTRDSKTDPNNHALITTVTKLQTCTQNGEALVTCANGCKYSLKTTLPADGKNHDFAEDFTVIESTCIAKGAKYKVCQNPGCKEVTEKTEIAINPAAHKNVATINAKDATCEEKGYTGDKFCNDCKKTIDPGIEINAKGHTESDWIVDKGATFTEEGARHTACTVCKKELKKEVIAKLTLDTPVVKIENVSNGIKVSWSQDEDATGYTVYSSTYNASTKKWSAWKNRGTAAANKSSWTDKTVTEGVTYRYTVRAVNGSNRSAYKATEGLLYVSAPKVTVTISSTGLLAKWNKVNNATGYIVYRRALVNGVWSSWVNLGTTAPEKNSWFDSNVQSGVSYRYTVRAVVNKVRGGYIASPAVIYLAQPLLKISNAKAGVTGKWEPIAGATGYTIYRSEYNPSTKKWTKWLNLGTTKATAKSFTDKTAKSGYQYKYTIRAVNGRFKSTYQDSNKLVYLAQPTLKISNVANGIQGSWNQVNGATGYIIYRREIKDGKWTNWIVLGTAKSTAKTFTDKTVKSGVTYRYTVRAKNGVDKSSYASTGSLVFLTVPTVKISNGITGVNVSWSKIDGATSYLVYRREIANGKWTGWSRITTVTETSFIDETAKSGTYYRYTVRALNGKSSSKFTSTNTLYYLATPIVTVAKADDGIKVNWTQVTGVTGYAIYRAQLGADGKWSKWVTLGTATDKYSSCKDKTAKTGVTYKYTVRAVNGKVKSAYIDGAQIEK